MKSAALRALESQVESALAGRVVAPFRTGPRGAPEMLPTGIAQLDALAGGLPRGALTEVVGPASSGRTSIMLAVLAAATARDETCTLVDTTDAFDPHSAAAAGVDLKRLLWIRCRGVSRNTRSSRLETQKPVEQALKSADLLLQSGGFGVVVIDLADVPPEVARRVPLTSWFRFRRAVEHTPTVLLVVEQEAFAKNCAALVISTEHRCGRVPATGTPSHARLFPGFEIHAEVTCDRMPRKPVRSATASFPTRSSWASSY